VGAMDVSADVAATRPVEPCGARRLVLLLSVIWLVHAAALLAVEYPPLQDYPNHLLRQHVLRRIHQVPVYKKYLAVEEGFRPNLLSDWVMQGVGWGVDLKTAGKITLLLGLALGMAAVGFYVSTFGGGAMAALAGAQLLTSWVFLKGNLNFHAAGSILLLYLGVLHRIGGRVGWKGLSLLAGLSVLCACAHGFVFGALCGLVVMATVSGRLGKKQMVLVTVSLLPAILLVARFGWQQMDRSGLVNRSVVYASGLQDLLLWTPLTIWERFDLWWDRILGLGIWCAIAVGAGWTLKRAREGDESARVLLGLAFAAVLLYFAVPDRLSSGWGHMKYRVAYLLAMLAMPMIGRIPPCRPRRVVGALLVGAVVVSHALLFSSYREVSSEIRSFVSLSTAIPRGSLILTVDLTPTDQSVRPLLHIWSYLCIERDCLSPFLFATQYIQQLYFIGSLTVPVSGEGPPESWEDVLRVVQEGDYGGLAVRGRSQEGETLLTEGLERMAANPSGSVFVRRKGS